MRASTFFGNDEHVNRRLRVYVVNGDHFVVFKDDVRRKSHAG